MTTDTVPALTLEQRLELERLLRAKRDELRHRLQNAPDDGTVEREADPMDEASEWISEVESSTVALRDARMLREVEAALERMTGGSYGVSEASGEPIGYDRLRVVPWARRSAEEEEQRDAQP